MLSSAAKVQLRKSDFQPSIVLNRNVTIAASIALPPSSTIPVLDFGRVDDLFLMSRAAKGGSLCACSLLVCIKPLKCCSDAKNTSGVACNLSTAAFNLPLMHVECRPICEA